MPSAFLVNLGGTDQDGIPNNQYRLVEFSTIADDPAGLWDLGGYGARFPVGPFTLQWQVFIDAGAATVASGANPQFVAKVMRNAKWDEYGNYVSCDNDCQAAIGVAGGQPGTAVAGGSFSGNSTNAEDVYSLFMWATGTAGGNSNINGDHAHTWMSGTSLP